MPKSKNIKQPALQLKLRPAAGVTIKAVEAAKVTKHVAPNVFRLGYLIHDVSRMRRTLFDQRMRPAGITRSQWWVLANLSRHKTSGVQSAQLAKELYVGKVTMGGLIDRLETAGYVFRQADASDGRAKQIFISPEGYELIKRMGDITKKINREICHGLSKAEIVMTEANLIHLKHNLSELLAEEAVSTDDLDEEEPV